MSHSLKIWIDLENSPHVLFFQPIIERLRAMGHSVEVTARDFCNTVALAEARGLNARVIGSGYDKGRKLLAKYSLIGLRAMQLAAYARGRGFDVAASHGSRTQALAAKLTGVPLFSSQDYEFNDLRAFRWAKRFMIPTLVPADPYIAQGVPKAAIRRYEGLKEEVYLAGFSPSADVRSELGVPDDAVLVVFRPKATQAHYGSGQESDLDRELMERAAAQDDVYLIVLPRTEPQRADLAAAWGDHPRVVLPEGVVDGPSLMYAADLVATGGGTMVREAVALGVPAVSLFQGSEGAVDRALKQQGRLVAVREPGDLDRLFPVGRRERDSGASTRGPLAAVTDCILDTATAPK